MNLVRWHPQDFDVIGFLGGYLDKDDPRPAHEQFDAHYQHGGGWTPFEGFTLTKDNSLTFPGDPPLELIAFAYLREECIMLYPYGWVAIVQPDRKYVVARMD